MKVTNQGRMPKKEQKSLKDHEEVEPGQWLLTAVEKLCATVKGLLQREHFSLQRLHSGLARVNVLSCCSENPSWSKPTSKTDIKNFLGLASYYRRFVEEFSKIADIVHLWFNPQL